MEEIASHLKRLQRQLSDLAEDRRLSRSTRGHLHDAEWHVCTAHHLVKESIKDHAKNKA